MNLDQLVQNNAIFEYYFNNKDEENIVRYLKNNLGALQLQHLGRVFWNEDNSFVSSMFATYETPKENMFQLADLNSAIIFSGEYLTSLIINEYTRSDCMPIIKERCQSLRELYVSFTRIQAPDFDNCFHEMIHLEELTILWKCKSLNLPKILINSLINIAAQLRKFHLLSSGNVKHMVHLPDTMIEIFNDFERLENFKLHHFMISHDLYESITKWNLKQLYLFITTTNTINVLQISKMTNLKEVILNHSVNDKFFQSIAANSCDLEKIIIPHTSITDIGIQALMKLGNLNHLELTSNKNNMFITKQTIPYLLSMTNLQYLCVEYCCKIKNNMIIELIQGLNELRTLRVGYTGIDFGLIDLINDLPQLKNLLEIFVSFEIKQNVHDYLVINKNIAVLY